MQYSSFVLVKNSRIAALDTAQRQSVPLAELTEGRTQSGGPSTIQHCIKHKLLRDLQGNAGLESNSRMTEFCPIISPYTQYHLLRPCRLKWVLGCCSTKFACAHCDENSGDDLSAAMQEQCTHEKVFK